MPGYAGPNQAQWLLENRQGYLWMNDTVPAGTYPGSLSVSLLLQRMPQSFYYPWGCSFELSFAGNPGSFEVDILGANTDIPANYVQLASIVQAGNTSLSGTGGFVWRYDMASNLWPKYVAAWMKNSAKCRCSDITGD